eukprot:gene6501-4683_t
MKPPSVFGVSSYFLWTQKGLTTLPLVRGSGFLVRFTQLNCFHTLHVVTAAHVSCPVRYEQLYSSQGKGGPLSSIGQRHINNRLLVPKGEEKGQFVAHPLRFDQHFMPNVDVSVLRLEKEKEAMESVTALEVDVQPVQCGDEVTFYGMDCQEAPANPNDDGMAMQLRRMDAVCRAAIVSVDYGTVLLASIQGAAAEQEANWPVSMCGGPVVRKASGKVVGVAVARVLGHAPPVNKARGVQCEPFLSVGDNAAVMKMWPLHLAFVPIADFSGAMRRSES